MKTAQEISQEKFNILMKEYEEKEKKRFLSFSNRTEYRIKQEQQGKIFKNSVNYY